MSRRMRGAMAVLSGWAAAAAPLAAAAQAEGEGRALEAPGDAMGVALITIGGLVVLGLVISLGYLYRRERDLTWDFQAPEGSGDHGSDEHH